MICLSTVRGPCIKSLRLNPSTSRATQHLLPQQLQQQSTNVIRPLGSFFTLLRWNTPCFISPLFMEAINTTTRGAVLAIDDEPELLEIVRGCLEPAGFQVYTASGAKEGVDFYEKNWQNIKLVLLDFLMPEMTGISSLNV